MEVLLGTTIPKFVRDDGEAGGAQGNVSIGNSKPAVDDSSDSSSIGAESEDEDKGDDVVSSENSLGSLASLEEPLPVKRGSSNYYSGKSRSFADLSQLDSISSAKDLGKPENPVNKRRRRRIRMGNNCSCSPSTRSSSSSLNSL